MDINAIYQEVNSFTKDNQILSAAVGVYGLSVFTYLTRNVPSAVYGFLRRQLTTSVVFDNTGDAYNHDNWTSFIQWLNDCNRSQYSRLWRLESIISDGYRPGALKTVHSYQQLDDTNLMHIRPGGGKVLFFHKGTLCSVTISQVEQKLNASARATFAARISILGRNTNRLKKIVDEFTVKAKPETTSVYVYGSNWDRLTEINPRHLDTVIVNKRQKESLCREVTEFLQSEQWYKDRGLTWALRTILYGQPGTGKTSLIKALAMHFGYNLAILKLDRLSDSNIEAALASVPRKSFVLIEDFDSIGSIKKKPKSRQNETAALREIEEPPSLDTTTFGDMFATLTLSGFLNALDGIATPHGTIIYLSTNVLDEIADNVKRSGRINFIHEIKALEDTEVREYIRIAFPQETLKEHRAFDRILGCDLEKLFLANKHDFAAFVDSIPKLQVSSAQLRIA